MKTLAIVTTGLQRFNLEETLRREAADEFPRASLFQISLNADLLDERFLQRVPVVRRSIYKLLPTVVAQALEAFILRKNYDVVITWSERRALIFALLLKLTGSKTKHVALMYWMSKPKQAALLRFVNSHIHRIVTWTSVQRQYAIDVIGIPGEKILFVRHPVDEKFFRPMPAKCDTICAVGSEMRDYSTLMEAMRGLDIKCHIASDNVRLISKYSAKTKPIDSKSLPPNVTAGYRSYKELRELYAQSRFAVVPLFPSDTDNGINAILEAMAMGKPVICSRTQGQVDVIQEGKNGLFVSVGDPNSLREAILQLWNNPSLAERMGAEARNFVMTHHTIEQFVASVKSVVEEIIGNSAEVRTSFSAAYDH